MAESAGTAITKQCNAGIVFIRKKLCGENHFTIVGIYFCNAVINIKMQLQGMVVQRNCFFKACGFSKVIIESVVTSITSVNI